MFLGKSEDLNLYLVNYVDASTPKVGEWAERWNSREPRAIKRIVKPLVRDEARIPAFGPLSNFGGGRIYIVKDYIVLSKEVFIEFR